LRIGALLFSGDTRVADQAAGEGGFPGFHRHFANRSSVDTDVTPAGEVEE